MIRIAPAWTWMLVLHGTVAFTIHRSHNATKNNATKKSQTHDPGIRTEKKKKKKKKKNRQPSAVMLIIFKWQLSSERNPFPVAVGIAGARPLAYSAD